jgi:hypothetical protein
MPYIVVQTTAEGEDVGYWEGFKNLDAAEVFRSHKAADSDDTFSITDDNFDLVDGWN